MLAVELVQPGIRAVHARHAGTQLGVAHQALHATPTDAVAGTAQLLVQPRTAVAAAVAAKQGREAARQVPVLLRVRAGRAAAPGVVAGAGDAVEPAEARDRVRAALRVDEREDGAFRAEQNRMAFFKRACSSCSSACARSSSCRRRLSRASGTGRDGRVPRKTPARTSRRHFDNMNG
jgi:hypothetical protein